MRLHSAFGIRHAAPAATRRAFTLVELLVVIAIIAVLIGILIPVVGKIRQRAYMTSTAAVIEQIDQACAAYYTDFRAYPGPLPNSYLDATDQTQVQQIGWTKTDGTAGPALGGAVGGNRITGTENLVLGLCGGLASKGTAPNITWTFVAADLGGGPRNFNPIRPSRAAPYFPAGRNLFAYKDSLNHYEEDPLSPAGSGAGATHDSAIPEFIDSFPSGMPIIYARARGGVANIAAPTPTNNSIVVADPIATGANPVSAYNLVEITPYTNSAIGAGRSLKPGDYVGTTYNAMAPHGLTTVSTTKFTNKAWSASYQYPYDAFDYLSDPTSYDRTAAAAPTGAALAAIRPRKDTYVLISAGPDRVYGTADDITNFGSVVP